MVNRISTVSLQAIVTSQLEIEYVELSDLFKRRHGAIAKHFTKDQYAKFCTFLEPFGPISEKDRVTILDYGIFRTSNFLTNRVVLKILSQTQHPFSVRLDRLTRLIDVSQEGR